MECVFDNPIHPNGGCIFADPNVFVDAKNFTWDRFFEHRIQREDEEILLIARAFIEIIRWH